MNNYWLIYKTIFKQKFRPDKSTKRSKSFKIGMGFTFGLLGIIFIPLIGFQLFAMASIAIQSGMGAQYLSMVYTMLQGITLFFGTILLVNTLFNSRENEFFATLPVRPQTIYFAKLGYVVTNELVISGVIGTIAIVIYGVMAKMGVLFYILGLLSIIITPLISLLISSILLFPLSYLLSFIRKSTTLSTILAIGAFLLFMVVYMGFFGGLVSNLEDPSQIVLMIKGMGELIFFNMSMAGIVLVGETFLTDLLIVVGIYAVGFVATYLLSSVVYKRSLSMQSEVAHTKIKKMDYQSTGIVKSLIARDWKCIKRDTSMFFQCGMMVIMPALMIALLFGVMYKGMGMDEQANELLINTMGVFFLVTFTTGANATATSSISRENRNFYLMKIIPVPYELQIKAKVLLAFIMSAIGAVTGGIALIIFGMSLIKGITLILTCVILSYGFSCVQVKFDLDKPKLNWENFNEAIKNSRTSIISMLISMGFSILVMGAMFLPMLLGEAFQGIWGDLLVMAILLVVSIVVSLFAHNSLTKNITAYFDKIEC